MTDAERGGGEVEAAEAEPAGALEEMLAEVRPMGRAVDPAPPAAPAAGSVVAECVDARHPTLRGRISVRWRDAAGHERLEWAPTLQGLPVRVGDRVLLTRASNWPEWVVTGVVDGFARRPAPERSAKAALELERDEVVRVVAASGAPLVEVFDAGEGPVVRLLADDVALELPGALRVEAASIHLEATRGQARVTASDDVVLEGETIHLN